MSDRKRRQRVTRSVRPLPPGWHLVPLFASDMAPCRCVTCTVWGVRITPVAWSARRASDDSCWSHYLLHCMTCGREWTRTILASHLALHLDATHPEERRARGR